MVRRVSGWLIILIVWIGGIIPSVWAERKVLEKPTFHLEKQTEKFRIKFDSATGNFVIEYTDYEGKPVSTMFEPATKVDVVVEAEVEHERAIYTYKYKLISLKSSLQRLQSLIVEYADAVFNITSPEGWRIGPLSFKAAMKWTDTKFGRLGIEPGSSQDGFSFQASSLSEAEKYTPRETSFSGIFYQQGSLPGIVTCYARGDTEVLKVPSELPEGVIDSLPIRLLEDAVIGKTVGPVRIPEKFDPKEFLKKIMDYNQESFAQGWIEDPQLVSKHKEKLEEIQKELEADKKMAADSLLSSFLSDVEAERAEKKLTSEAYALLKYNVKYLRSELFRTR